MLLRRSLFITLFLSGVCCAQYFWPFYLKDNKTQTQHCFYPFIEWQKTDKEKNVFVKPFAWHHQKNRMSNFFLYPFSVEHKTSYDAQWIAFFGLFSHHYSRQAHKKGNIQLAPFYFSQYGYDADSNYAAIFPLGGTVKNFLGKNRVDWFLWPLWVRTQNNGFTNYWFPWPFLNYVKGQDHHGFAIWPLGGHYYKNATYDNRYFLWPFIYNYRQQLRADEYHVKKGFLPFFAYERSPRVKDLSCVWPIWGDRYEIEPRYEEHRLFWPLWIRGDGENITIRRWAPFYTYRKEKNYKKQWWLWPLVKRTIRQEKSRMVRQEQFLYFVIWNQRQQVGNFRAQKSHFWPLFSYWNSGNDEVQLQIVSPLEVFFQGNRAVQKLYNDFFALYRYLRIKDEHRYQWFWNFIQASSSSKGRSCHVAFLLDSQMDATKNELVICKGLVHYKKTEEGKKWYFFWKNRDVKNTISKRRVVL